MGNLRNCMQNRDLSWLKFNERVLEESNFRANPLLERLKFVSIFVSNLDEFYMVRVGSLTDYKLFAPEYFDNKTGMTADQQLQEIFIQTLGLYSLLHKRFFSVVEELRLQEIHHLKISDMRQSEIKEAERYFIKDIMPMLSPQIIGKLHPFPHIDNKHLHIAAKLEQEGGPVVFGLIPVPKTIDRLFFLKGHCRFILLEDVIYHFAHMAFSPYKLLEKTVLTVTRNSDIDTKEERLIDEEIDYPLFMKRLIKKRQRLAPVRLEFQYQVQKSFKSFFLKKLKLEESQAFNTSVPLDLSYCFDLEKRLNAESKEKILWPAHVPANTYPEKKVNMSSVLFKKDILFHYPFESMSPFLRLISQSSEDESVISIKITLYRLDFQSKLANSLIRAAENGKEVIVIMELRARFDEANNINWSQRLEEAGCTVIFGLEDYKVHSKICLITKRENNKISYITQIGTGNYNEKTAKQYTDFSLITMNRDIGEDAAEFFKNLLLGNMEGQYKYLWVAPNFFKPNILKYIKGEIDRAKNGMPSRIIIKCNSLTDKGIILKLIEASQAGVEVLMIVRGGCCLIPQVAGFTHNIKVISIVGRFLEHTRVYFFGVGAASQMFISSADLMTRNTERRVEIGCPILDEDIREEIYTILKTALADNTKAWELQPNGKYTLRKPGSEHPINSQEIFLEEAARKAREIETRPITAKKVGIKDRLVGLYRILVQFRA